MHVTRGSTQTVTVPRYRSVPPRHPGKTKLRTDARCYYAREERKRAEGVDIGWLLAGFLAKKVRAVSGAVVGTKRFHEHPFNLQY